jgi:DMSO/TMAO reductase YedYZ molybdopterin-dependent catalytic subunit
VPGCGGDEEDVIAIADLPLEIASISSNDEFYVLYCCGLPEIDPEKWSITIRAGDETVASLDAAALAGFDAIDFEHTLECIGARPGNIRINNAIWSGLPLTQIFEQLGVVVEATTQEIRTLSADEYDTSLPASDLDAPLWLVWAMNGEPLPALHGGPARFITPGRYGMKNPKWITEIDLIDYQHLGHYEKAGWSNTATYRPNALILSPPSANIELGNIRILGTGFAGPDPITRVEVSTNDGANWQDASIDYSPGANIWTLWHLDWTPPAPGRYVLRARVTTESGKMSHADAQGTTPAEGYDGSMATTVTIA